MTPWRSLSSCIRASSAAKVVSMAVVLGRSLGVARAACGTARTMATVQFSSSCRPTTRSPSSASSSASCWRCTPGACPRTGRPSAPRRRTSPGCPRRTSTWWPASIGPAIVDKVKRGPGQGLLAHRRGALARHLHGALAQERGGRAAQRADVGRAGRHPADGPQGRGAGPVPAPVPARWRSSLKKTFRKGDPKDFLVGPKAARLFKEGLVLRDSAHRGGTVVPYK